MHDASAARRSARFVRLALFAVLAGHTCIAAASEPNGPKRALAIAADVTATPDQTRLTITLSQPVDATAFVLADPDRAVIELPDVNFQLGGETGRRRGGVISSLRCGTVGPGRSRIVVDLSSPARVVRLETRDSGIPGAVLLTIDFARSDRDAFRRAVSTDRSDLALTTGSLPRDAPQADRRPLVAIDAGHGGIDPGATAPNGAVEKDITLSFAGALRDRLAADGRYRLLLIRDHDVFVPLDERVRKAREAGADLFLSIHADIISNSHVSGATIYIGGDRATDAEAATLAERENAADEAGGLTRLAMPGDVTDILHELTLRETRVFSGRAAASLLRDLAPVVRFSAQPQREAGFKVLRTPDLPSVLVELGYLSNARDLELMLSPEWRSRTAAAMASAINRFFAPRVAARAPLSP